LIRKSLFAIAICLLMTTTLGCTVLEAEGKPSADFSNRTVTAEQGSSFTQELRVEGRDTDYKHLKIYFRMPDGVTCPDTPKMETLDEGEEWTVTVTFHVASSVNPGTYTVFARGEWEEFNQDTEGWEGNEGELTKFTLIVEMKTEKTSQEEEKGRISLSSPLILGVSGVSVVIIAAGVFLYLRSRQRTGIQTQQIPMRETEEAALPKRYCRYCGASISLGILYCQGCGRKVEE